MPDVAMPLRRKTWAPRRAPGRCRRALAAALVALLAGAPLPALPQSESRAVAGSTRVDGTAPPATKTEPRRDQQSHGPLPRPDLRRVDVERVYARQNELIDQSVAALAPRKAGATNVYVVAAAAFAEQDVFVKEAASARQIMDERLATRGRSLMLVNHVSTIETTPLFNMSNLDRALKGVAKVMSPEEDVLVLFLTSHGNPGLLNVSFNRFGMRDIEARALATVLKLSKIRHRIIIISACYSGSFIPLLKDDHTMIITAARGDRTSFGCSNEREWTYFGDAFFNRAMRTTASLPKMFEAARETIAQWERDQKLTPSEPQMFIGPRLADKLGEIERALAPPLERSRT